MSKIEKFTVSYEVSRSAKYQSVRVGGSLEVTLLPDEKLRDEMAKARAFLAAECDAAADAQLAAVLDCVRNDL
jgi:hypothetical protein